MNSQIIQLAREKGINNDDVTSVWSNDINNDILLEAGDMVRMKNAFIDINVSNSDEFIKVQKKITITAKFGFYIVYGENYSNGGEDTGRFTTKNGTVVDKNSGYYYLRDGATTNLYTITKTLEIPEGVYTKLEMAKHITDELSSFNGDEGKVVSGTDSLFQLENGYFIRSGVISFILDGYPISYDNDDDVYLVLQKNSTFYEENFCYGASQPEMIYENGRYKLSLFTPATEGSGQWVINLIPGNTLQSFEWEASATGAFITDYTDDYGTNAETFFSDVLGFDMDTLVIKPPEDTTQPFNFKTKISELFVGTSNLRTICGSNFLVSQPATQTQQVNQLYYPDNMMSGSITNDLKGGHYLLNINTMNQSGLTTEKGNKLGISAILSKQYNLSSTITVYGESSAPYIHQGVPVKLSNNFNVQIIDPETMKPASGLGTKHYIYLEVIKPLKS